MKHNRSSLEVDDWMIGGSRDVEGERAYGFGPGDAAHCAALAYNLSAEMFPGSTRKEFAERLAGVFLSELLDVIDVRMDVASH